jgi:diguanylate cyclase
MTETPHPAQLAKGALRRLAQEQREPTPENYARAYAEEQGLRIEPARAAAPAAAASAAVPPWSRLVQALVRGLDRGGRHWTLARRKDSLKRLLERSGKDDARLAQRLEQLLATWAADRPDDTAKAGSAATDFAAAQDADADAYADDDADDGVDDEAGADERAWPVIDALQLTVGAALPGGEPRSIVVADDLSRLARRIAAGDLTPGLVGEVDAACREARRLLGHRHLLVDELLALCRSLTEGLIDLAEDPHWVQGQTEGLRARLDASPGTRAVRAARVLFDQARSHQREMQAQRVQARDALKATIQMMLVELGELDQVTGRFGDRVGGYAEAIESADSLEGLATLVRDLLGDSREVHGLVVAARERLAAEHARAGALQSRVLALEQELRQMSDEATTDALTQVANRRGLVQLFEAECARQARAGDAAPPLSVALIDIDNFKKLNDSLGHAAGDEALKSLAARVKQWLRPVDHLARFGGEEFVVLLPGTPVDEAQQVITRLQRQLSASLFMHEGREVFVTFSAGVTRHRGDETVEAVLERADEGLYEAKRTGKNRTCIA